MNPHLQGIGMTSQRTRLRMVQRLQSAGIGDTRVLEALAQVPRHLFVDEALASRAYEDTALPIGDGQTISQPYVVARMTEVLLAAGTRCVLEVGTGCGYQTAVLARLVDQVFSVERIGNLHHRARARLGELGVRNVRLRLADGYVGWAEHGPYDGILVAAAPAEVPPALLEQLADGGRMVIPVGGDGEQRLSVVIRRGDRFEQAELELVSFVPMLAGTHV